MLQVQHGDTSSECIANVVGEPMLHARGTLWPAPVEIATSSRAETSPQLVGLTPRTRQAAPQSLIGVP